MAQLPAKREKKLKALGNPRAATMRAQSPSASIVLNI